MYSDLTAWTQAIQPFVPDLQTKLNTEETETRNKRRAMLARLTLVLKQPSTQDAWKLKKVIDQHLHHPALQVKGVTPDCSVEATDWRKPFLQAG